jgi:hypothetical protein
VTFQFQKSLPVDWMSPGIRALGGTEARGLVSFDGKLYAGIGYWSDRAKNNPNLPGAQILSLDRPGGKWKVDLELDAPLQASGARAGMKRFQAIGDLKTVRLGQKKFLLASLWDRQGGLIVLSKQAGSAQWARTPLVPSAQPNAQIRSFGTHTDSVTGQPRVFAGTSPNGIFSGGAGAGTPSGITWSKAPEPFHPPPRGVKARVTSFCECNGKLFATVRNQVYQRADGPNPSWELVAKFPYSPNPQWSGFRGATAIPNPNGPGQVMLMALEGNPLRIMRFDPARPAQGFKVELNVSQLLTQRFGLTAGYGIAGYNDMAKWTNPRDPSDQRLLMGLEIATPSQPGAIGGTWHRAAMLLQRSADGTYSVQPVRDGNNDPSLSARSVIASPFAGDPPGTIYASGPDANAMALHNTAWIYRGVPS